eukprot:TRINITY_DN5352_c0_g2_i1.p1 TRINITY_DN5352_c0_g2~~TRINITY_DN5352_c0_g2_i1.p1  ORF type:complete len:584 (-),score=140.56 TRINITY_DN5352_c0_g2_i1:71-1822(-)
MSAPTIVNVVSVPTTPFEGQKTGTSGLRKRVKVFMQEHYLHNWLQSLFNALPKEEVKGSTLVIGGDGRYWNDVAVQMIIKASAANGVRKLLVGQNGIFSTPALSYIIREEKAYGGLILTASHNPGGPDADWGIKYNCSNGGPAPEGVTAGIFEHTVSITKYEVTADMPDVDLAVEGVHEYTVKSGGVESPFTVSVIDSCSHYQTLLENTFDFETIRKLLARDDFKFVFDGLHGVTGVYAQRLFVDVLGAPSSSLQNCVVLEDFGGGHPDPNLVYAKSLVTSMRSGEYAFGAASDGDGDRNMVLGNNFFINACDSLAVLADNSDSLLYFQKSGGLKGVARSMPTSGAVDRVAKAKGLQLYEVPTGWKFFGNIMDKYEADGTPGAVMCGEESFGTGSDHIREKDGIWAVMAWLSVIASRNKDESKPLCTPEQIVREHWIKYGRNCFTRYDYENVAADGANKLMDNLRELQKTLPSTDADIVLVDDFEYTDPIDHSVTSNQGLRFVFADGSRIIFRLSGTGSVGATVRIYVEKYLSPDVVEKISEEEEGDDLRGGAAAHIRDLVDVALRWSKMEEYTGRREPTVIT